MNIEKCVMDMKILRLMVIVVKGVLVKWLESVKSELEGRRVNIVRIFNIIGKIEKGIRIGCFVT